MGFDDLIPDKYLPLFGEFQGIFQSLNIASPGVGDWPYYYGGARVCDVGTLNGGLSFRPPAGGIGTSYQHALMSIIGEGIERYCASFPTSENFVTLSAGDLAGKPVLLPEQLCCFSDTQHTLPNFPFTQPTLQDPITWVRAKDLYSSEIVLVPANRVYIPYYGIGGEQIPGNSTGLACGANREMSIQNAIYEAVERDAYALCWLFAGSPPNIDLRTLPEIDKIIPCHHHPDWQVDCYDLTGVEEIPIFLIALQAPRSYAQQGERWYCHGVAAHLDARVAITKAFREAMLGYYSLEGRWQTLATANTNPEEIMDPIDFDAHALFYNKHPDKLAQLIFLNQQPSQPWGTTRGSQDHDHDTSLSRLLNQLAAKNIEGAIIDLTTDDVHEFDLHVSRVLLKGFSWLHGDNRLPFLGSLRAQQPHLHYDYIAPFSGAATRRNIWPHSLG